MVDPKPRKRIVPIQIAASPTLPSPPPKSVDTIVEQKGPSIASLQAQANAAEKRLGADRKLYVALTGLDPSKPMVDWKELLKGRGLIKPSKPAEVDNDKGPLKESEPVKQLTGLARVIARLEQKIGMGQGGSSDSEGGASGAESSSEEENETEPQTDGGAVTATDGEEGRKKHRHKDDYDHMDDFIDDSEFIELFEESDRRQTKFQGFFITRGEIERVEDGTVPQEKKRRRKPEVGTSPGKVQDRKKRKGVTPSKVAKQPTGDKAPAMGSAPTAVLRPANADEGTASPKKRKRKKIVAEKVPELVKNGPEQGSEEAPAAPAPQPTLAQLAAQAGAGVAQSGAAVAPITQSVAGEPRKSGEVEAHHQATNRRIAQKEGSADVPSEHAPPGVDETKEEGAKSSSPFELETALEELRQYLAAELKPSPPLPEEATAEQRDEAEAAAWKAVPKEVRTRVYSTLSAAFEETGKDLLSAAGKATLARVHSAFPEGTLSLAGVRKIYAAERRKLQRSDRKATTGSGAGESAAVLTTGRTEEEGGYDATGAGTTSPDAPTAADEHEPKETQAPTGTITKAQEQSIGIPSNPTTRTSSPGDRPSGTTEVINQLDQEDGRAGSSTVSVEQTSGPLVEQQQGSALASNEAAGSTKLSPEAGLQPTMTDDAIIEAAISHSNGGVSIAELRAALDATKGALYAGALTRALALAGSQGSSTFECASQAIALGLLGPGRLAPESRTTTVAAMNRATHKAHVAHLGSYRFALKAFEGVVDVPRPLGRSNATETRTQEPAGGVDAGPEPTGQPSANL